MTAPFGSHLDRLFDMHVHIGASDTGQLYYGNLSGEEYLDLATDAGVTEALVFPPTLETGYRNANLALAQWCERTGRGMRPLARVGGTRIGWTEPEFWLLRRKLRRLIGSRPPDILPDELGRFAGLKLLPQLDGLPSDEIFAAARERRLPVLTHGGKYVGADFIERAILPKIEGTLVIAHLGAFPDRERELGAALDLARRDDRVYLDTSGIWIADFLRLAVARVPEKLVFGSDCPLTHPRVAWNAVEALLPDDTTREAVAWRTAEAIFGPG